MRSEEYEEKVRQDCAPVLATDYALLVLVDEVQEPRITGPDPPPDPDALAAVGAEVLADHEPADGCCSPGRIEARVVVVELETGKVIGRYPVTVKSSHEVEVMEGYDLMSDLWSSLTSRVWNGFYERV